VYPQFKKWETKHGERKERGAKGLGVGMVCLPPHAHPLGAKGQGVGRGDGVSPSPPEGDT